MSDIAVSISCKIDGKNKTFLLENIEDVPITESSTISRHPIPSGDYVSDTMYKEPIVININGSFSLSGKKGIIIDDQGNISLQDIEKLFSRIRKEGILCDIVKVKISDNNSPRFSIWKSMALQSISWIEKINTLGFGFTFQQVMQVNISDYDVDENVNDYPDVEDPQTLNFTESLLNTDEIIKILTTSLIENDLIEEGFIEKFKSYDATSLAEEFKNQTTLTSSQIALIHAGVYGGLSIVGIVALIITKTIVMAWAGWIGLAYGVIAVGIFFLVKYISEKNRKKINKFEVYKNEKKMKKEAFRFLDLYTTILGEFSKLNDVMSVYQVSSNKAQQCILSIDNDYYCFTFTRSNTDNSYGLFILDMEGNIASNTRSVSNIKDGAEQSLETCNSETAILKTDSGYQVFLVNPLENRTNDLTENYILISSKDMSNFYDFLKESIDAYLLY